jgi:hypothetical protein
MLKQTGLFLASIVAVLVIGGSFTFVGGTLAWVVAQAGNHLTGLAVGSLFAVAGAAACILVISTIEGR